MRSFRRGRGWEIGKFAIARARATRGTEGKQHCRRRSQRKMPHCPPLSLRRLRRTSGRPSKEGFGSTMLYLKQGILNQF